jgi:hypothetical protein
MSFDLLMSLITDPSDTTSRTYAYILGKIDWIKLRSRAYKAWTDPTQEQRCVLFEYDYFEPGPMQGQTLHSLMHRQRFIEFMDFVFKKNNPRIQIYSRRKIINGAPSFVRRQLVVVFQSWSLVPPPPPCPVLTRQNAVCLDEYLDDESTTISSIDEEQRQCHCQHD